MTPAAAQIRESGVGGMLWIVGTTSTVLPLAILAFGVVDRNPWGWRILCGCAILGVLILSLAAGVSLNGSKSWRAVIDSPMLPAICGGVLAGRIRMARPLAYREPIHLLLYCMLQNRGSQPVMVWEDDLLLDQFAAGAQISEIPVFFRIPPSEQPTGSGVRWRLNIYGQERSEGVTTRCFRYQ